MTGKRLGRWAVRAVALVAMSLLTAEGVLQAAALVVHLAGRRTDTGWSSDGLRVLALGDSNTFGIYLDEKESYPSQLETLLNQDPGLDGPVDVLNFGYPGNSTGSILEDYERSLEVLDPDVVLFLAGANDYWAVPIERPAAGSEDSSSLASLAGHLRLYRLWRIARGGWNTEETEVAGTPNFRDPEVRLEIERRGISVWLQENGGNGVPVVSETREHGGEIFAFGFRAADAPGPRAETDRNLEVNLREFHEVSGTSSAVVLTMTYPSDAGLYRLANAVIRRAARAQGETVIDLAMVFSERCAGDLDCPELLVPDGHPTARGYAVVAEVLRDEIRARVNAGEIRSSR